MILVRDVFRLQFGKARPAIALWKEGLTIARQMGVMTEARLLTDLVGPDYYTLILELTFPSLTDYEQEQRKIMSSDKWKEWYQRFLPLAESGHRELLTIVD